MYLRYHIFELTVIGMFKATLIGMFKATLIGTLYTESAREHELYSYTLYSLTTISSTCIRYCWLISLFHARYKL